MSLYVDVVLDKPRRLKLSIMDMAEVYESLNRKRKMEVNGLTILGLLASNEWNIWAEILATGFRHQDPKITPEKCLGLLSKYAEQGGDTEIVSLAIVDAMAASGAIHRDVYERFLRLRGKTAESDESDEERASGDPDRPFVTQAS